MKFSDMPTDFKISKVKRDASKKVIQESHIHPYYEIFYLVNGDCTFFINHDIYKLNKGDLVIVPEGELHKSTYPQRGFSEQYCLCFKDNNLEWLKDIIGEEIVNASLKMGVISIPEKRRDYVEALMKKMLFESKEQDILSAAFIKIGLIELLLFIIRCQRFEQNVIKEIDVDNQLMQQIATYIYNNYNQKITLEHMADKFHISKSYLSKKFKSVTGFGFKEYLVNVRIKNACTLLLDTNKSITDIAFECGFNDSNYFGDAFRHVKGMSPNKYRRNKETI
ncbi:MAG: AraC family transcriptional regulator [Lachnospira sp.]